MTRGALSRTRVLLGFATALIGGPLLSWLLVESRGAATITGEVLAYQLLVVIVALIGGIWPALFTAVLSGVTLDFLFVAPLYDVTIADPVHVVALVLYVVIAILVSTIVDRAARRHRAAAKATAEAELLAAVAGTVLRGESAVQALVARTREAFGATGVRLVAADGTVIASDGEPTPSGTAEEFAVGDRAVLEVHGTRLDDGSRRLLTAIVAQLAGSLENADLAAQARTASELAAADQVRSALLSAVSHDVRRPLAAAIAAVGGLRTAGPALASADRIELLDTAAECLDALATLITDLLDVSRVQAGALGVRLSPVDLPSLALASVDELGFSPDRVTFALAPEAATAEADGVLLQRAVVNLLANADRHTPEGTPVTLASARVDDTVELRVIDHGPGVDADNRESMFLPFQRHGDTDNTAGLGLGLALSRGFVEGMGGQLRAEETPGGGLTMIVQLPAAETRASAERGSDETADR